MFMDFLNYANHAGLFSEEISRGGEGLGVSAVRSEADVEHASSLFTRHIDLGCIQSR
jgi:hypothetical protein